MCAWRRFIWWSRLHHLPCWIVWLGEGAALPRNGWCGPAGPRSPAAEMDTAKRRKLLAPGLSDNHMVHLLNGSRTSGNGAGKGSHHEY